MKRDVRIRPARPDEHDAVANVLDGALLDIEPARLRAALESDEVLVATDDERIVGALVLDGRYVEGIAVRRVRRDRGIGSALVNEAVARVGRVTADFDARVRPFYDALGFSIEPRGDGQFRGALVGDDGDERSGTGGRDEHDEKRRR